MGAQLKQRCAEVAPGVPPRVEGAQGSDWLVVDCGGTVVHVRPHLLTCSLRRDVPCVYNTCFNVPGDQAGVGGWVVGHTVCLCISNGPRKPKCS